MGLEFINPDNLKQRLRSRVGHGLRYLPRKKLSPMEDKLE